MEEEGYRKDFFNLLLRTIHDLAKDIKEMRVERRRETPRGLKNGESSGTSHHWYEKLKMRQDSQRSTIPTFLAIGNGVGGPQE